MTMDAVKLREAVEQAQAALAAEDRATKKFPGSPIEGYRLLVAAASAHLHAYRNAAQHLLRREIPARVDQ